MEVAGGPLAFSIRVYLGLPWNRGACCPLLRALGCTGQVEE